MLHDDGPVVIIIEWGFKANCGICLDINVVGLSLKKRSAQ